MFSNLKEFAVVSALVYLHMAWFPTNQFTLVLPLLYIYYNCGCDKYSKDIKIGLALAVIGDLFIPYQHTALKLVIQMALFLRAIFFVKGNQPTSLSDSLYSFKLLLTIRTLLPHMLLFTSN